MRGGQFDVGREHTVHIHFTVVVATLTLLSGLLNLVINPQRVGACPLLLMPLSLRTGIRSLRV